LTFILAVPGENVVHGIRMRFLVTLLLVIGRLAVAAGIENAVCEQTGPCSYHIDFQAPPEAGSIAVYTNARADRIDSRRPLLTSPPKPGGRDRTGIIGARMNGRHIPHEGPINFRDLGGLPHV
jgi:hypothetical protein